MSTIIQPKISPTNLSYLEKILKAPRAISSAKK